MIMAYLRRRRARRARCISDPQRFFDSLIKARLGDDYSADDRYRDFRDVFTSASTEEQGNRVLWQLFEWARMFAPVTVAGDTHESYRRDGERNLGLRILAILNTADRQDPEPVPQALGDADTQDNRIHDI